MPHATSDAREAYEALVTDSLRRLWPSRTHREALLDLPERKTWSSSDEELAIAGMVAWWADQGLLPAPPPSLPAVTPVRPAPSDFDWLLQKPARWADVATLVGTSPSALANGLTEWPRPDHPTHLWLATLGSARQPPSGDAFLFHRRSRRGDAAAWARLMAGSRSGVFDVWDVLHLHSLILLHQRRRRPAEARANRGASSSRRTMPKPGVAVTQWIPSPGFAERLAAALADAERPRARRRLALLLGECALTGAFLGAHVRRRSRGATGARDDARRSAEELVERLASSDLLGPEVAAASRVRLAALSAYVAKTEPVNPLRTPYFELSRVVSNAYWRGERLDSRTCDRVDELLVSDAPGTLMLRPQLRSLLDRSEEEA